MGNHECKPLLHNIQHLKEAIQKKLSWLLKERDPSPQKFSPHNRNPGAASLRTCPYTIQPLSPSNISPLNVLKKENTSGGKR
jgi:hypothetical protein